MWLPPLLFTLLCQCVGSVDPVTVLALTFTNRLCTRACSSNYSINFSLNFAVFFLFSFCLFVYKYLTHYSFPFPPPSIRFLLARSSTNQDNFVPCCSLLIKFFYWRAHCYCYSCREKMLETSNQLCYCTLWCRNPTFFLTFLTACSYKSIRKIN